MTKKCSIQAFANGCVERTGDVTVSKRHGAYCVMGFDKKGQHVNTCRRTPTLARKVAAKARRTGLQDRYGQLDGYGGLKGASASAKDFKNHPIIRQIVGRMHVGDSDDDVVAYAKTRLAKGAWESMKPASQRAFVREVKRVHAANRKLYWQAMGR